jgi:uncharacterized protein YndB with AHSA1/START domain
VVGRRTSTDSIVYFELIMTNRFYAERKYEAPSERVFSAWTDVDTLRLWFGCSSEMLWQIHEWEVRVGGQIRVSLNFGDKTFEVEGAFLVVDPPHHLRYRWDDDQIVDVQIEPCGTGSLLKLEHRWPPTIEDRSMIAAGWTSALDQLGALAFASI